MVVGDVSVADWRCHLSGDAGEDADERPDLVRAIVALEPRGPVPLSWGLSDSPLTSPTSVPIAIVSGEQSFATAMDFLTPV